MNYRVFADKVYKIIGAAMAVHRELGWGLLEPVYQEAMQMELISIGVDCEKEKELEIYYKGQLMNKKYRMDLVVDDIVVELKSVQCLTPSHRAQLCNYLRLTQKPVGLLVNFGEETLVGERWVLDKDANVCMLVDKKMTPVYDANYESLLDL